MKILAVGGGSGGHVTPVAAVFAEIRRAHPDAELRFWCDQRFATQARAVMREFDPNLPVGIVLAGKLRRYHHLNLWQHLTWPTLMLRNLGDSFLVLCGIVQSFFMLLARRPDVIFMKGGYVCLPVGISAHLLRIPFVVHDSDAYPGLTNRVLSRWARFIATGAPLEHYHYPAGKAHYVGTPVGADFRPFSADDQRAAKEFWGVNQDKPLLVVTGGGQGAQRINDVVVTTLTTLLTHVNVVLISGAGQYDDLRPLVPRNSENFQLHGFVSHDQALLFGAADMVIARAGATTILELAALAKPTILIPNGKLTGGHQLKNAAVYSKNNAVIVLNEPDIEADPRLLVGAVEDLLAAPEATQAMAERFHAFAKPDAAHDMAELVVEAGNR